MEITRHLSEDASKKMPPATDLRVKPMNVQADNLKKRAKQLKAQQAVQKAQQKLNKAKTSSVGV